MNKNLIMFFIGTKLQSFVAALYKFGFLIIFYQKTNSLVYSSLLTAMTIMISRLTLIFAIPHIKKKNPVKISIIMNFLIGVVALIAMLSYVFWSDKISGYFVVSILFSVLEQIDNSFQYSVIPSIVKEDYLFKANSLNAIFTNINLIAAPIGSYIFYTFSDLRSFLLLYSVICFVSCFILNKVNHAFKQSNKDKKEEVHAKKKNVFIKEWKTTLKIIFDNSDIVFCISIGTIINLIFAGLNGAVLLKMGSVASNKVLGQTLIKIVLSVGSLLGVTGVYKLKVKENYERYLKISIVSLIMILLGLAYSTNEIIIYMEFLFLAIFIMFIMNSTGTFLQMISPKEELPAIYAFRSTLYAIVVPASHLISGLMLEYLNKRYYFLFSAFLIILISIYKIISNNKIDLKVKTVK